MAKLTDKIYEMTDEEEAELIASTERGEWVDVPDQEQWKEWLREVARNTLNPKRKRISISVPEPDLARLKAKALEEGIPYQTLINSLIHKYVNGRLD